MFPQSAYTTFRMAVFQAHTYWFIYIKENDALRLRFMEVRKPGSVIAGQIDFNRFLLQANASASDH